MAALFTRDVDSAERFARRCDRGGHLAFVSDIAGHRDSTATRALDVTRAVCRIVGARIDAHKRGAFGRETLRDAAADIRAGPRDQRHFSAQLHLILHHFD
jgi:hypothetical protein